MAWFAVYNAQTVKDWSSFADHWVCLSASKIEDIEAARKEAIEGIKNFEGFNKRDLRLIWKEDLLTPENSG